MQISRLTAELVELCAGQFEAACGYAKPENYFRNQLERQDHGELICWVARDDDQYLGHARLIHHPNYPGFQNPTIPEISDLNVAGPHRRKGIATRLIHHCEQNAGAPRIGIGVGLYPGYNNAQRLYCKLGYMIDGRGVHYQQVPVQYGERPPFDDSLILHFLKDLRPAEPSEPADPGIRYIDCDEPLKQRLAESRPQIPPKHWHLENGFTRVALAGDEIAGFLSIHYRPLAPPLEHVTDGFIDIIEVVEKFRARGIATGLVSHAEERCRAAGAHQLRGWSTDDRVAAIRLWKKLGFGLCPTSTISGKTGEKIQGYLFAKPLNR
jgi:GNAT superfamily N-acetyltransferase